MARNWGQAASAIAVGTLSALALSAAVDWMPTDSGPTPDVAVTVGAAPAAPTETASPDPDSGDGVAEHPPVTITVGYWGNFGIAESERGRSLEELYEAEHPWVSLETNSGDYGAQHDLLQQALIAGSGAFTVSVIDEGFITKFVAQSDDFVNLLELGAGQYQEDYPAWKWQQAANADGSVVIGLGADASGLALCYRKDLFEAAGLPSDRDAVSAAVGDSWEDFINFGEQYVAATGKKFIDNATNILNPAIAQYATGYAYYNLNNELDMDNVKPAFDISMDVITAGLSAGIGAWSPAWNAGFANGDFAVTLCPSWMLGYITGQISADTFSGQWDVADIPGPGGNWGGSFYTIPKQGTEYEQAEAYAFVEWLIQPEQQLRIMDEADKLPSRFSILDSDAIDAVTNPFFNDAPVGNIFARTVLDIPVGIYNAPNNGAIRVAVESVLNRVQAGSIAVEDAWTAAVAAAESADF